MSNKESLLTVDYVLSILDFDTAEGKFYWRIKKSRNTIIGKEAGTVDTNGYIYICINRKFYFAHRLAWFVTYGDWPGPILDHIDRDKKNNRVANLREVTHIENCRNKGIHPKNTSGITGVTWNKNANKWQAQMRQTYLGLYTNAEDAELAVTNFLKSET